MHLFCDWACVIPVITATFAWGSPRGRHRGRCQDCNSLVPHLRKEMLCLLLLFAQKELLLLFVFALKHIERLLCLVPIETSCLLQRTFLTCVSWLVTCVAQPGDNQGAVAVHVTRLITFETDSLFSGDSLLGAGRTPVSLLTTG